MAVLHNFGGIFPRIPWHLLPDGSATIAHDVKLRNQKVEAWRERLAIAMAVDNAQTIVVQDCCMLSWDECVTVANYVVDYGRSFVTGRVAQPEVMVLNNCNPNYYFLGVPAPESIPQIKAMEVDGRDCSARSYVYTYVNIFGEESAPSTPSKQITVRDGEAVVITNIESPPLGYGIVRINIYRTATAFRDGTEKEQEMYTDFLKVASISINETSYTDTVLEKYLGPICNTREVRVPPKDLRYIRNARDGVLTGVTSNEVHFSAPYQPYNWPAEYDLTLPHNIVNMVTVDNYAIVSTDSYPYVISAAPNCEARKCRPVSEVDIPLPDISCGYPNSAIATPFGMVYSSKDGLVLVGTDARFQILTARWFSTDDWIKLRPDTVRLAYWRGYLFCITDAVSLMLEIDGNTYQDFDLGSLVTIRDKPIDIFVTDNGELLLLEDSIIYQWNAGKELRDYIWESRELNFGGEASPTTAKIRTDNITFKLLTETPGLYYERQVTNEKPFRLGRLGRHLNYRIGLYGTGTVDYVDLGMMNTTINYGK